MTRTKLKPEPHTEIAAAIFAGALAVFALAQIPARTPAPGVSGLTPVAGAAASAPAPLRSASYYPEHLAALQSLSGFQPMADAGDQTAAARANFGPANLGPANLGPSNLALGGKPVFEPKAPRRADAQGAQAKTAAAPQPGSWAGSLAQPTQTAVAPPPTVAEGSVRIFGMPLPGPAELGAQMNAQAANLRDTAGRWGAAASGLGRKVADLWRH